MHICVSIACVKKKEEKEQFDAKYMYMKMHNGKRNMTGVCLFSLHHYMFTWRISDQGNIHSISPRNNSCHLGDRHIYNTIYRSLVMNNV